MNRAILCSLLLVAACSTPKDNGPTNDPAAPTEVSPTPAPTPAVPTGYSQVRVLHAAPDAPAVDVYVSGQPKPLVANLSYGSATEYAIVAAGDYTFDIRPAGAIATSAPVFSTGALTIDAGARITAVATGLLASSDSADKFRVLALAEGFAAPADGKARVRVVHLSPDAPTVDLDVGDDGTSELTGLDRFTDTGASGVELPAGQKLQVAIRAGGQRVTAFTTKELGDGAELFVLATGLLSRTPREDGGFALMTLDDHGIVRTIRQNPVVYALHASPDAPTVDLFVGQNLIVDALPFGGLSVPVQVPPGQYTIDFYADSASTIRPAHAAAASATTPALVAGERYLAEATGYLTPIGARPAFELVTISDGFKSGTTTIRGVHAAPDAPKVDIGVATGTTVTSVLFGGVSFGQASDAEGSTVSAGAVRVGVAPAGNVNAVAVFTLAIAANERSFVIAAGSLAPAPDEQTFRLLVVDTATWPWTATAVAPH